MMAEELCRRKLLAPSEYLVFAIQAVVEDLVDMRDAVQLAPSRRKHVNLVPLGKQGLGDVAGEHFVAAHDVGRI